MTVIFSILYVLSILCSVVLFAPSIVPAYVKWPVALLVVLFIIFLFNLSKKDTKYTTKDTTKRIVDYGLINPLIIYLAASTYLLGFSLIISHLQKFLITDIVNEFGLIIDSFEQGFINEFIFGSIFIVLSIFIFLIRNEFKNNVGRSSMRFRAFWYIFLTLIAILVGIFNFDSFANLDLYGFILTGLNLVPFAGVAGLIILIEFTIKLIRCIRRCKRRKAVCKSAVNEDILDEPIVVEEPIEEPIIEESIVEEPIIEEVLETPVANENVSFDIYKSKTPLIVGLCVRNGLAILFFAAIIFCLYRFVPTYNLLSSYILYILGGFTLFGIGMDIMYAISLYRASINKKSTVMVIFYCVLFFLFAPVSIILYLSYALDVYLHLVPEFDILTFTALYSNYILIGFGVMLLISGLGILQFLLRYFRTLKKARNEIIALQILKEHKQETEIHNEEPVVEEMVEEIIEEPAIVEAIEEPVVEVAEEVTEEPAIVEAIEEPAVEVAEEVTEESVVEVVEVTEEAAIVDAVEEPVAEEVIEEDTEEFSDNRKSAKFNRIVAKERARMEKKLSKQEAKLDKQIQKRKNKLAK